MARIRHLVLGTAAVLALLLVTTALPTTARPVHAATNCDVTESSLDAVELEFLRLINVYRGQNGLVPLGSSPSMNRASVWMAKDMADYNYFSHNDRLGRTFDVRMGQCDVAPGLWGENIAAWYDTAQSVFDAWKASPGHNANMLNATYRSIGIARVASTLPTANNTTPGFYWVNDFSNEVIQAAPPPPAPGPVVCTNPTIDVWPNTNFGIVGSAFTVYASAVCPTPVFQFWVGKAPTRETSLYSAEIAWQPLQLYSATTTATWRPTQTGFYYVTFWAKNGLNAVPANTFFETGMQLNMMVIQ